MIKIRFNKKLSAWALSHYDLPICLIIVFYFHFVHDGVFDLYSVTDVGFFLGSVLSHLILIFNIVGFLAFLNKEKHIPLHIENGSIFIGARQAASYDRVIVKRRRISDNLADIIFVENNKTSFKVEVYYVGEDGLESIIEDLKSLGCPIEIQRNML